MKRCRNCGELKPLSEFHKKSTNKDGLNNFCSECCSIRQRDNRSRQKAKNGVPAPRDIYARIGGPYKVVYCPCDSFGSDSSYTRNQIADMLDDEYLAIGTRFRRGVTEYEVSVMFTLQEVTA